jgi:hypothetical protein
MLRIINIFDCGYIQFTIVNGYVSHWQDIVMNVWQECSRLSNYGDRNDPANVFGDHCRGARGAKLVVVILIRYRRDNQWATWRLNCHPYLNQLRKVDYRTITWCPPSKSHNNWSYRWLRSTCNSWSSWSPSWIRRRTSINYQAARGLPPPSSGCKMTQLLV